MCCWSCRCAQNIIRPQQRADAKALMFFAGAWALDGLALAALVTMFPFYIRYVIQPNGVIAEDKGQAMDPNVSATIIYFVACHGTGTMLTVKRLLPAGLHGPFCHHSSNDCNAVKHSLALAGSQVRQVYCMASVQLRECSMSSYLSAFPIVILPAMLCTS